MTSLLDLRYGQGSPARIAVTNPRRLRRNEDWCVGGRALAADLSAAGISVGLATFYAGKAWNLIPVLIAWALVMANAGAFDMKSVSRGTFRAGAVLAAGSRLLCALALVSVFSPVALHGPVLLTVLLAATTAVGRTALSSWIIDRHRESHLMTPLLARGTVNELSTFVDLLHVDQRQPYELVAIQITSGSFPGELDLEGLSNTLILPQSADPVDAAIRHGIRVVAFVGRQEEDSAQLRRLVWRLGSEGIDARMVPVVAPLAPPEVDAIGATGLPSLSFRGPARGAQTGLSKILGDKVLAMLGLLLLSPLLAGIALSIKWTSPGPVLFRQERVGRGGEKFTMLKFRTMVANAEALRPALEALNRHEGGTLFKMENDPRITPVGRFLRRYSLDELPQLVNVVRGEMSLVGPRPPLPNEVAKYQEDAHRRFRVRPGLTGLWQVSGRSDLSPSESTRLDTHYVEHWSPAMDLAILARTLRAVVGADGAY